MKIYKLINQHPLFAIYLSMFFLLCIGVITYSGFSFLHYLGMFLFTFLITYLFFMNRIKNKNLFIENIQYFTNFFFKIDVLGYILISITIFFSIAHIVSLNHIPIISAFKCHSSDTISIIRNSISENKHFLWNYGSSFVIKAFFPFFILYLYVKGKKLLFTIFLTIGLIYTISLISKSPVVTIVFPVLIYALLKKRFFHFIIFSLIVFISIASIVLITNPSLRGIEDESHKTVQVIDSPKGSFIAGVNGIFKRTVLTPGEVVTIWFDMIPSKRPFLYGSGYRFIAPLKNVKFINYSTVLYSDIYPENIQKGINGSLNTASFMEDYSNFGIWGLIMSGIILGILFSLLQNVFLNKGALSISINIYPILLLSSTSLTTLLFSGGWGFLVILYLIFEKSIMSSINNQHITV